LEELYKKVLDTITNIVSAANSLPKMFGKIPGVAISIGASIISTIKSVLTLFINSIAAGLE
jgi:phage-related protein